MLLIRKLVVLTLFCFGQKKEKKRNQSNVA